MPWLEGVCRDVAQPGVACADVIAEGPLHDPVMVDMNLLNISSQLLSGCRQTVLQMLGVWTAAPGGA